MCILDISKTCLYEFHHEYMAPLFRDKCKIMYTDTDSLIYHVECDDVYNIIKYNINGFDMNDYSIDNSYDIPLTNKKVTGLMTRTTVSSLLNSSRLERKCTLYVERRTRKRQKTSRATLWQNP